MDTQTFDWKRFHAYRVFDEYLEKFVVQRRSYVTRHSEQLNLEAAFEDIRARFVAAFNDSDAHFTLSPIPDPGICETNTGSL